MKLVVVGLILLALYSATGPQRKTIKHGAREILDQVWEVQEELAETEEMRAWIRYWREISR